MRYKVFLRVMGFSMTQMGAEQLAQQLMQSFCAEAERWFGEHPHFEVVSGRLPKFTEETKPSDLAIFVVCYKDHTKDTQHEG